MNKNIFIASVLGLFLGMSGTAQAETLTGNVTSIDQGGKSIMLVSESDNSSDTKSYKIMWDDKLAENQRLSLTNVRVGQAMTVDADQNPITRSWKVTSVGGSMDVAEKTLLRANGMTLAGEIIEIDQAKNTLLLRSKDLDDQGEFIEHRLGWDTSNASVTRGLSEAEVGDDITLAADQNVVTRSWKITSISGPIASMLGGDARTLTGEVRKVDIDKNSIVLYTTNPSGTAGEQTIVWDNDFKQQARLEGAKVGDRLSVRADQNMITRNWKVSSLNS
jgi:hypothetical protein